MDSDQPQLDSTVTAGFKCTTYLFLAPGLWIILHCRSVVCFFFLQMEVWSIQFQPHQQEKTFQWVVVCYFHTLYSSTVSRESFSPLPVPHMTQKTFTTGGSSHAAHLYTHPHFVCVCWTIQNTSSSLRATQEDYTPGASQKIGCPLEQLSFVQPFLQSHISILAEDSICVWIKSEVLPLPTL